MSAACQSETQFAVPRASIVGVRTNPYEGMPRFDDRYMHRYAVELMQSAKMYGELDRDRRDGVSYIADWRSRKAKRLDAGGLSIAFARQLEYVVRTPIEARYPSLRAQDFIPVMTEVPPDAPTFTYRMTNGTGVAAIINENGGDAPKVDVEGKEWQQPVVTVGASYDYTILDTMRAARAGIPLEALKAKACRFAIEYLIEQLACVGNAAAGLVGITNAPGVVATSQVSGSTSWAAQIATIAGGASPFVVAAAILADIQAMQGAVYVGTNTVWDADTLLVPVNAYLLFKTTARAPQYQNDTFLTFFKSITGLDIQPWVQLNTAGASLHGVTGRVMLYKKDPEVLQLVIPQPFTQQPPQAVKMAWEILAWARTGAVQVKVPPAVTYMDGVA